MSSPANDTVEQWPAIYLQARCFDCGHFLFSERYHEANATPEVWPKVCAYWRRALEHHRPRCPGRSLDAHRELAAILRLMLDAGKIAPEDAAHLIPILNGIPRT